MLHNPQYRHYVPSDVQKRQIFYVMLCVELTYSAFDWLNNKITGESQRYLVCIDCAIVSVKIVICVPK